jgi:hypothetical protein
MSLASAIEKNVYMKLVEVQSKLKAPKSQFNKFGNYAYRNCEDILEALKPLLNEVKAIINISDDVVLVGERYYIKATVKFICAETGEIIEASAMAREEENKKGMDSSQLTGSTSSYARKYALNGLFAIDDTKDSDTTNTHNKDTSKASNNNEVISEAQVKRLFVLAKGKDTDKVKSVVDKYGFKSSKDITKDKYNSICEEIEKI